MEKKFEQLISNIKQYYVQEVIPHILLKNKINVIFLRSPNKVKARLSFKKLKVNA